MAERTDVLIVTALQDELEAVLELGESGRGGWEEARDLGGFRYHRRTLPGERGAPLHVAAAWIGEMGERATALRVLPLIAELAPACLAMCGICAGRRGEVSLGDVIVADRLYSYDHGKLLAHKEGQPVDFLHDIKTYNLEETWKMDAAFLARELDLRALAEERPPSREAQRWWLLHALKAHEIGSGVSPLEHPERKAKCPGWTDQVKGLLKDGLVERKGGELGLTELGREQVAEARVLYPDGPPKAPRFRVHVGAVATGKAVQQDPGLFDRLRHLISATIGVEMEGVTIGDLGERFKKRAIVVKAVSDHADGDKDDSFRAFACRASAVFLMAFLQKHLDRVRPETPLPASPYDPVPGDEGDSSRRKDRGFEDRTDSFLARVERVAALRAPKAVIVRRKAPAPFSGVLEVSEQDGPLIKVQLIAALLQPIIEARVTRFIAEIEGSYREQSPLPSILVHTGSPAPPELARTAYRRGVLLKSFAEYQGLIDFTDYLGWQSKRLSEDPVYPPSLYVEQPARVSIGGDEEQPTENALQTLWELLDAKHPRFALILGEFGAGKTFLLHELARRMATEGHPLTPVLVEMSKLEKQSSLSQLLAQHFGRADLGRFDFHAFRYMLNEGRIALLFDGFDELALRVTYDRALEHFDTLIQAVEGSAKVVVTSRTQHFLTDNETKLALAERAAQLPGYRLLKLKPFGETQIRRFLVNHLGDEAKADARFRLLDEVKDLLGLSHNPRMLGFITAIEPAKLQGARARTGEITAAKLYEVLIDQWLDFEHARANPRGAPRGITRAQLRAGATELAMILWQRTERAVELKELPSSLKEAVEAVKVPGAQPIEAGVIAHQLGSGSLLVRNEHGAFSFVHQSILEWLVADAAAKEVQSRGDAAALAAGEMSELMADFFVSLAGPVPAAAWATRTFQGGVEGHAKKNALRVMGRLGEQALAGPNLAGQDLSGQDLSGRDLRRANLDAANLERASLLNARLGGASLISAKLGRADLRGADLQGADLQGADLSFARLLGADLRRVRFEDTSLRAAKLIGAKLDVLSPERLWELEATGAALAVPQAIEPMWLSLSACNTVTWNRLGDLVASGHTDGSIRLWDCVSGQALRVLWGHEGAVTSVAFSGDGARLASGSSDRTAQLWEVATGRAMRKLKGHTDGVMSVAFSGDGEHLASGSSDRTVQLWEVATGRAMRTLKGHADGVTSVAFSGDGAHLASGSADRTVRLWEVATGRAMRKLKGHTNWVTSVAFSGDGARLASGSADTTVRVYAVATGRAMRTLKGHTHGVTSVAFSGDGARLASGSSDRTVRLWEVETGRAVRSFGGHDLGVMSVAFSGDGVQLASGSSDMTVRLWEVATGRAVRAFEGHSDEVTSVAFSGDGARLASGSADRTVQLWEVETGRAVRAFEGHSDGVMSVAFSGDGARLASGSADRTVQLWEVETGRAMRTLKGHTDGVMSVAFSGDGAHLASGSADRTVRLWEVETGRAAGSFEGHELGVMSVAFSGDGARLASGSADRMVRLWEVATGREVRRLKGHTDGVMSVAFSGDGAHLASGSADRTVRVWEVETGLAVYSFAGHTHRVMSVAFSSDGARLASGSADRSARVWEVETGREVCTLKGHTRGVMSVAFSPDGTMLASASSDGTLRLWDVATGACLTILLPAPEGWAAFTPDGRYKFGGAIAGSFWHVIGLCRFEPGELDPYLEHPLRLPDDAPLFDRPAHPLLPQARRPA